MDEDTNRLELTIDAAATLILAAAAAWAGALLLGPLQGGMVGSAALLITWCGLHHSMGAAPRFELPAFTPSEWPQAAIEPPLELTDALPMHEDEPGEKVVRLHRLPTPGEMRGQIDRHMQQRRVVEDASGEVVLLGADASAALRQAIGELKRALG
jgi:hypothetical protein